MKLIDKEIAATSRPHALVRAMQQQLAHDEAAMNRLTETWGRVKALTRLNTKGALIRDDMAKHYAAAVSNIDNNQCRVQEALLVLEKNPNPLRSVEHAYAEFVKASGGEMQATGKNAGKPRDGFNGKRLAFLDLFSKLNQLSQLDIDGRRG